MARSRNIKPAFFANEDLAELDCAGRLLFIGLWTLADREGRIEYRPKKIKAQLFPYDPVEVSSINRHLTVLARLGFISFYREAGLTYLWIVKFTDHQSPHKTERESTLPAPTQENTLMYQDVEALNGDSNVTEPLSNGRSRVGIGTLIPEPNTGNLNPSPPAKPVRAAGYTAGFEELWQLVPKTNCSKQEAARSYQQAVARGASHEDIIRGIRSYRVFLDKSGSPAAHATTWLNGGRWTVDYEAALAERRSTQNSSSQQNHRTPPKGEVRSNVQTL